MVRKATSWLAAILLTISVINYPNPFNPKDGEITTFECTANANSSSTIYLYDLSARMLWHKSFTIENGTSRLTWNGYSDENELVKNGVYLYRIVTNKNTAARGKVWVVNQ